MSEFGKQYQNNRSNKNALVYDFEKVVTKAYPIANTAIVYPKGTPVTLNGSGQVAICTHSDRPFGIVKVANRLNDTDYDYNGYVTVVEAGVYDHAIGYADTAAVATGALVTSLGTWSNDPEYADFRTAASGEYVIGICVSGGADGSQIEIALFAQPFELP